MTSISPHRVSYQTTSLRIIARRTCPINMIVEILIFIFTFIIAYYLYVYKRIHKFYEERGVKYVPGVPVFGNVYNSTFAKKHALDDLDQVYKAFPNERYVGYIEGTIPVIMIRDPELIKTITVKDFDHFVNHREFFSEEIEPLFGGSLFMMKDERWRDMRTTLSPAFTGSKMRMMMPFMIEISKNIIDYLKDDTDEEVNAEDLIRRYTNDVIASAGFGLQVNSIKERDNEFFKMGQNLFKFNFLQRISMFLNAECPKLAKMLGIKIFPQKTIDFFKNLVTSTIEYRKKNNLVRPDMIQLLMEASKGTLNSNDTEEAGNVGFATTQEVLKPRGIVRDWTENELTGQVFLFFAAGFESSAGALTMTIHELALNPDIQEKLYQEIKQFDEVNELLTFDNISNLKYLDCVVNETLRKWSPAIFMDRVCSKPYELPPPREGGKPYLLKPGDIIYNMVNCIQTDEKYYPKPEIFDPERFSDENKHKILPFTFMPFGMGPRNCIGSRFALLELKVLIYFMVLKFKILKSKRTMDPIVIHANDFNIKAKDGSWVKLEARK